MTNQQAVAKAKKRWGKTFYVRNSGHFSSPEQRKAALDTVLTARAEIKRIEDEITERLKHLDWYQELLAKKREQRERISKTEGEAHHYRFNVGRASGFFNEILGQGDTWEEAFEQADKRSQANAA